MFEIGSLTLLKGIGIFILGIIVGFINVLAAGGSFLTLAFLIAIGLPANVANGTTRVGLIIQNVFASLNFHKLKILKTKFAFLMGIPAIAGALLGSYIATCTPNEILKKIIAVLMVLISLITIYKPDKFIKNRDFSKKKWVFMVIAFFFIGIYGGFIQAGVGFFIITASIWGGFNMVEANSIKVLIIMLYTIMILPVFLVAHQVNIPIGILLGLGSIIGAKLAINVSIKKGDRFIRAALLVLLVIFAIKLFLF